MRAQKAFKKLTSLTPEQVESIQLNADGMNVTHVTPDAVQFELGNLFFLLQECGRIDLGDFKKDTMSFHVPAVGLSVRINFK